MVCIGNGPSVSHHSNCRHPQSPYPSQPPAPTKTLLSACFECCVQRHHVSVWSLTDIIVFCLCFFLASFWAKIIAGARAGQKELIAHLRRHHIYMCASTISSLSTAAQSHFERKLVITWTKQLLFTVRFFFSQGLITNTFRTQPSWFFCFFLFRSFINVGHLFLIPHASISARNVILYISSFSICWPTTPSISTSLPFNFICLHIYHTLYSAWMNEYCSYILLYMANCVYPVRTFGIENVSKS